MSDKNKKRYEKMIVLCDIILADLSRPTTSSLDSELCATLNKLQNLIFKMEKEANGS